MPTWRQVGPSCPDISVDIAFASDPADDTPTWTSVTTRLRQYHARLYRQTELDEFQTGEFFVVLDNRDRELEPGYTGSSLYPNVKPRKRMRVQSRLRPRLVAATATAFTATASPSLARPIPHRNSDLVIAFFVTESAFTFNTPWTDGTNDWLLGDEIAGSGADCHGGWLYVQYQEEWDEGDPPTSSNLAFTSLFGTAESGTGLVLVYRGCQIADPINTKAEVASGASATSVAGPSVTPTSDGCTIVQLIGCDPTGTSYAGTPDTSPIGTERYDAVDAGQNSYIFAQDYWQETAAAVALDATGLTADAYVGFQLALEPAVYYRAGGFIRSLPVVWPGQTDATVTVSAADFGMALNRAQVTVDGFPEEETHERIDRVLDAVGVAAADRDIEATTSVVQAIPDLAEGAQPTVVGALEHCRQAALSDGGYIFAARTGIITFHNRAHRRDAATFPIATFGDAASESPYRPSLVAAMDDSQLWNRATVLTADGIREEVSDSTSETENWPSRRDDFQSLLSRPGEAASLASLFVWRYKDPRLRFPQISASVDFSDPDTSIAALLFADVGDVVRLKRRPTGGGTAINEDVHIEGITEDVIPGQWNITFDVSAAEPDASFWVLGTSQLNSTAVVGY